MSVKNVDYSLAQPFFKYGIQDNITVLISPITLGDITKIAVDFFCAKKKPNEKKSGIYRFQKKLTL